MQLSQKTGARFVRSRAMSGDAFALYFESPVDDPGALAYVTALEWDPAVVHVTPIEIIETHLIPNDANFGLQWALGAGPGGIDAVHAWDISTGSTGTVIAVIDTGILPHPDFAGRIAGGYDFISSTANAGDGGGRDSNPTDAGTWASAGYCTPGGAAHASGWHGTHVAGIIAATGNNGSGIAGIDWHARLLAVRVLGKCGGDTADVVDGMRWAAGLFVPGVPINPTPARVINMSLGGRTPC